MVSEHSERNLRGKKRLGWSPLLVFWFFFFFLDGERETYDFCVWCLTLCNPMDYSPRGSSVHGDSPGKNTGVGCHALLQGIFPTQGPNPDLPHCRQILYWLSHQGKPTWFLSTCKNEIRVDETHSNSVVTYLHLSKLIKFFLFLTLKNKRHSHI